MTDNDKAKGDALAERLGRELYRHARQDGDDDGGHRRRHRQGAGRRKAKPGKPAVIADIWDNPGGGVAGDGTLDSAPA